MDLDWLSVDPGGICRCCLSDRRDTLRSIFDASIKDLFVACTSILVSYKLLNFIIVCSFKLLVGQTRRWFTRPHLHIVYLQVHFLVIVQATLRAQRVNAENSIECSISTTAMSTRKPIVKGKTHAREESIESESSCSPV